MKLSIITVVYNNIKYIKSNLECIEKQSLKDIEHIVIDGGSTDGTFEYLQSNHEMPVELVSEPDSGIYDAMNKGLKIAKGDIIGFLNSDDIYASDSILERIAEIFSNNKVDSVYGDLVCMDKDFKKTIRHWKSGEYREGIMENGWMPPHPAFFVRKSIYDKYGNFNTDFEISSDYELMLRLLHKNNISTYYLPKVIVNMRSGGKSYKVSNYLTKFKEDYMAMKTNNIQKPLYCLFRKNIDKLPQFFNT